MPGDAAPLVRFIDVRKSFDGRTLVVKDLNLDVLEGEFLTLLGPSGSGKTTTLMMLAGFESITHGDITLAGLSLKNIPPYDRDIGMVFQNYALFPHMTVEENLAFPLEARRLPKDQIHERTAMALDMVRLSGFERRRPMQLSGGQQQRVAVARALVYKPRLILMDEPLGALDKQLREQMQYELKSIHGNTGITVVYVTHDQTEALTMSDRVAVFNDGCVQQLSDPRTLYEEPENAFVAQFIGENNRLPGEIVALENESCRAIVGEGAQVRALAVNCGRVGSRTTLSLRPESVRINPPDGACDNIFAARIEELVYLGDHLRVLVRVCGQDEFAIKVPRNDGMPNLRIGQDLTVGWNIKDCRALEAS